MKHHQKTSRGLKFLIGVVLGLALLARTVTSSFAATTTVFEDNFNAGIPADKWRVVFNKQTNNPISPCFDQNYPANWGIFSWRLGIVIDGPPCMIDLAPTQLDLKNTPNYTVNFDLLLTDSANMDRSFVFLWQDPQNWYDLKLFGNTVTIEKVVNGKVYTLPNSTGSFPFALNQIYSIKIEVSQQREFVVKVNEHGIFDVPDQAPFLSSSAKKTIAFRGSVGAVSRSVEYFDNLLITTESSPTTDTSLGVPLWKQSDPRWAELLYDHADKWTDITTMRKWGCAVTSMAMVMKYHGIDYMPNGEALTPESLNLWLAGQPDGYFSGNLNWLAVTRLTRLINAQYGTKKLEYTRADTTQENAVTMAKAEIANGKPAILATKSHFFVADGISSSSNTLLIKDPAFVYTKLSQHKNPIIGIRKFQPSYTDLSYLMAIVPKDLQVEVKDAAGQPVEFERTSDYLTDAEDESETNRSPEVDQILVAKPDSGNYMFSVSQPNLGQYNLDVYSYDVAGNVLVDKKIGTVGSEPQDVSIQFHKGVAETPEASPAPTVNPTPQPQPSPTPNPTPDTQKTTWKNFFNDVQVLIRLKQFTRPFVGRYVELLAWYAIKAPANLQRLYAQAIEQGIKVYKPFIKSPAYQYMSKQLKSLKGQTEAVQR